MKGRRGTHDREMTKGREEGCENRRSEREYREKVGREKGKCN